MGKIQILKQNHLKYKMSLEHLCQKIRRLTPKMKKKGCRSQLEGGPVTKLGTIWVSK